MKKTVPIFVIIFIFNIIFMSGVSSQWVWQNPFPTGSTLHNTKFLNINTGYAVGSDFTAIKTTNGGMNWHSITSNFDSVPSGVILQNAITSLFFIDTETGFMGRDNLFKTTDGGNRWVYLNSPFSPVRSIFFTDDNTGYITGDRIAKTTDGGHTWVVLNTGILESGEYESISFPSADTGYVSKFGSSSYILKTTNAGIDWTVKFNVPQKHFYGLQFLENNIGYACYYYGGYVMKTINGGDSWENLEYTSYITSLRFTTVSTGYVYGENGALHHTTNGGANWAYSHIEHWANIDFPNDTLGYLVGRYGIVWKTTNSGLLWDTIAPSLNNDLLSGDFINRDTGYAAGRGSTLLKTTNGGAIWSEQELNYNYDFNYIGFQNENTGYLCGLIVLKTTDAGLNWDSIAYFGEYFKTQFVNSETGYIGSYSFLYKTTNGGINWIFLERPSSTLSPTTKSFSFSDNSQYGLLMYSYENWPSSSYTKLYSTVDSGQSWVQVNQLVLSSYMYDINLISDQVAFMNGGYAGLLKTNNGGYNWSLSNGLPGISKPYFYNLNVGYFTWLGRLYKTINGGADWTLQFERSNYSFNSLFYTDVNTSYILGNQGVIFKTTNGGGTMVGLNNNVENIPEEFILRQNFPNPFNPSTKISFDLPVDAKVKLTVYDMLGREVKSMVNTQLSTGRYEYQFEGSNFSSGIYFYRIEAVDNSGKKFVQTKRMVLVK